MANVEYPPLLDAGFYPMDWTQLYQLTVQQFDASSNRETLLASLAICLETLHEQGIPGTLWIDGSFLTQKLNPNDIDAILVMHEEQFHALDHSQREVLEAWVSTNHKEALQCDTYFMIVEPDVPESDWGYAYWVRQFGFSRSNQMKGIAVLQLPGESSV